MSNWIDKYKKLVISSHKQHIIIADQDSLFEYEELKQAFENDGFKLITYCKTDLAVRLVFELQGKRFRRQIPDYCSKLITFHFRILKCWCIFKH
jgi:Zn/Cd-binding protein ZinT